MTCVDSSCRYDDHLLLAQGVVEPEKDAGRGHSEGGPLAEERQTQPELDTGGDVSKAEGVIIGVIRYSGIRNTQLKSVQRHPFGVRLGSLVGIMANRPVPFMEEAFIVAPGAHGLAREIEV